jgi:hypothetical protein
MAKMIETIIRLRRDNDYNYEAIKNSFVPANGEVVLVDTAHDGLRAKVGDGYSTYAQLQFTDADIRNAVQQGYYENGVFYKDFTLNTPFPAMINKIYIDIPHRKIYYYNGEQYVPAEAELTAANANTPGIMKLYSTTGQNTDGTMTQKSISDELGLRVKMDIDSNNELLIFSL